MGTPKLSVIKFESLGSNGGDHLAGHATFSDGKRLHVYGRVGGDWAFMPDTPEGMRSVGRPLIGRRGAALNLALPLVLAFEQERNAARDRVKMLTDARNDTVERAVGQLQATGARMVDKAGEWIRELDAAAASLGPRDRAAKAILDVARRIERLRGEASEMDGTVQGAEDALNEAKAQFEAMAATVPPLVSEAHPEGESQI